MQRFHGVAGISRAELTTSRHPCGKCSRALLQRLQLVKGDAQGCAGKALVRNHDRGRLPSGAYSIDDPSFERNTIGIAITLEQDLEGGIAVVPERVSAAKVVSQRMWRMDMGARNPTLRQRLGRRMGPTACEELRKDVGMGAVRASAAGRRDRLKHLGATDPTDEDAVRIDGEHDRHDAVIELEHRLSSAGAQRRHGLGIVEPDARVDLKSSEAEIEQDAGPVLAAQRPVVRADLGERRAPAHGARGFRKTERYSVDPAFAGGRFRRDKSKPRVRNDPQTAPTRDDADPVETPLPAGRLLRISRKFGDGAKRPHAPSRPDILDLSGEEVHEGAGGVLALMRHTSN